MDTEEVILAERVMLLVPELVTVLETDVDTDGE